MKCKHCGREDYPMSCFICHKCRSYYCVECATNLYLCNDCDPQAEAKIKLAEFEKELNKLIDKFGMTRKYLIEINQELQVMNLEDFNKMREELDEFDGIHSYIIKGRVI